MLNFIYIKINQTIIEYKRSIEPYVLKWACIDFENLFVCVVFLVRFRLDNENTWILLLDMWYIRSYLVLWDSTYSHSVLISLFYWSKTRPLHIRNKLPAVILFWPAWLCRSILHLVLLVDAILSHSGKSRTIDKKIYILYFGIPFSTNVRLKYWVFEFEPPFCSIQRGIENIMMISGGRNNCLFCYILSLNDHGINYENFLILYAKYVLTNKHKLLKTKSQIHLNNYSSGRNKCILSKTV